MSTRPRILAFGGSLRQGSWNHKLVDVAADAARSAGADVTVIRLSDFPMPILNEDDEKANGLPDHARALRDLFRSHQGLMISSPEYNSSVSAALKNAIDWVSRPEEGRPPLDCFAGKVAGLLSASPGALGGLRGLVHLRAILGNIQVLVHPNQYALGNASQAFVDDGKRLKDDAAQKTVERLAKALVETTSRQHA